MIKPLGDTLIVKGKEKSESKTASGLIIPKEVKVSDDGLYTVTAVGKDVTEVSVGDVVHISLNARRNTFTHDGEQLMRVHESELLYIVAE